MSEELKIELQVDAETSAAKTKVDNLIDELKKKKPIDLQVNVGKTDLTAFNETIKSITTDLKTLSELKFSNLKTIETSLKNVAKAVKEYQGVMSLDSSSSDKSVLSGLAGFEDFEIDRLSNDHKEALTQVKSLQQSAIFLKDGFSEYQKTMKEAYKSFGTDNADYLASIREMENKFDTTVFKNLLKHKREFNEVVKEYNSIGITLTDIEDLTNEKYDGTLASRKYQQYLDTMGLSAEKFEEIKERAIELNARKRVLIKNIRNNLAKASDEEKEAFTILSKMYEDIPPVDTSAADNIKKSLEKVLKDDIFSLDFSDLDLRFEEDFEEAFRRFFKKLNDVQDEYNTKFKDTDGFEKLDIFDTDGLREHNAKLEREVDNTVKVVKKLTNVNGKSIDALGFDTDGVSVFDTLSESAQNLQKKLKTLKRNFENAFEISDDSAKSLEKIKDALVEINRLTDEQKQTFFDFGLDVENIKKAKDEANELADATKRLSDVNMNGLIESFSILTDKQGTAIKETQKIRTSALSTMTKDYKYVVNEQGQLIRELSTVKQTDEVSKRANEIVKKYENVSKDLRKAQSEYYKALADESSSEGTINHLNKNVREAEAKLLDIRELVDELEDYPKVVKGLFEELEKIDDIRRNQIETDTLKIIDKAELSEATNLLKETKSLIDQISKNSIQLQKDINAGYDDTVEGLEARIKQQEQQVTKNLSKLLNISNSKAITDQIYAYQLDKAQKTQIEIARINDKANKSTGVKTVDEQDKYLKQYKDTLTQIKSITKSLAKENTDVMNAEKVLQLDKAYKKLDEIKSKLNEVKSEAAEGLYDKAMSELDVSLANSFSKTVKELDKVEEKIAKLGKSDYANTDKISGAESIINNLRNTLEKGLGSINAEGLSKILIQIENLKAEAKNIDLDIKISKDSEKIETFIKGVTDQLEVLQSTANNVDISHITNQFKDLKAGSDKNSVVMKSITDDVKTLEKSLKSAGDTTSHVGLSFRGFFDDLGDSLRTFTLGEIIGDVITDSLYQTWDVIKEMDAAMANLKKVADASDVNTSDKLDDIRSQAIQVSQDVGAASSDVINAIADSLQAGVGGMQESIQVARSAMVLANVGDMTQQAASEALNTIINSYKLDPLKEIDVQVGGLTQKTTELANAMDLLNYAG